MTWHAHSHLSRGQVAAQVPVFTSMATRMSKLFCAPSSSSPSSSSSSSSVPSKLQITVAFLYLLQRFRVLSNFDAGHVQMQHGGRSPGRSKHGVLNLDRFVVNSCIHNLGFNTHAFHFARRTRHLTNLHLRDWRLRRMAAVSLTHARQRTYPALRVPKAAQVVSCLHV